MLTVFARTLILYLVSILAIRLMGKRQIGELRPTDLVVALLIADLAAVPMQETGTPLLHGILPMHSHCGCVRQGCPCSSLHDGIQNHSQEYGHDVAFPEGDP